jgi:antitoxin ChpS
MFKTNLRQVGGSVMLAVPPAILDLLHLHAGSKVALAIEHGRLMIEPSLKRHYTLDELLAQCNASTEINEEYQTWLNDKPTGGELL